MELLKYAKITLLIVILVEEIKRVAEKRVTISRIHFRELKEFKKEYRKLINSIHFKTDDSL
ncbi:TPA: hypothetical protein ACGIYZ_002098 [Staphylococcus argenteus]|nr:hypothetical protein M0D62_10025 [Staphylococcus argenteus]CDR64895.1 hypothetical protein ERS154949_02257 [Staphylococcus argenteus]